MKPLFVCLSVCSKYVSSDDIEFGLLFCLKGSSVNAAIGYVAIEKKPYNIFFTFKASKTICLTSLMDVLQKNSRVIKLKPW